MTNTFRQFTQKMSLGNFFATSIAYTIMSLVIISSNIILSQNIHYAGTLMIFLIYISIFIIFYIMGKSEKNFNISFELKHIFLKIAAVVETAFGVLLTYWIIKLLFYFYSFNLESIDNSIYLLISMLFAFFILSKFISSFFEIIPTTEKDVKNSSISRIQIFISILTLAMAVFSFIYFSYINWDIIKNF